MTDFFGVPVPIVFYFFLKGGCPMERSVAHRWRLPACFAAGIALAILFRRVLLAVAVQVLAAATLMLLALPLCRALERRMPPTPAAVLSLLSLFVIAAAAIFLGLPPLLRQMQQLTAALPALLGWVQARGLEAAAWLSERGVDIAPLRDQAVGRLTEQAGTLVSRAMAAAGQIAGSLGQVLLSPLLAFYLLRDRQQFAAMLTLLLPVSCRARGVRAAREMRRETAAYLRGQLILSLAVAGLTAIALLLAGTPGWLLLGGLMGILELVPYVGPVLAGVPAVLLALQNGWIAALWTLAALLVVQQAEGTFLSPRLLAGATQLHPMAVLLLVSVGGMLGGAWGMVLVIPLVVSLRGAIRGWRE